MSTQLETRSWYRTYYHRHGKTRNDVLRDAGVLFQQLGFDVSATKSLRMAGLDRASAKILDVGCGGGGSLPRFFQMGFRPEHLYGIDILQERIDEGRCRFPNVNFTCGDAASMPYDDSFFNLVLPVKGSIVECGVFRGFGFMSWAKLSTILEPENFTRRIYGFDTFTGFPSIGDKDENIRDSDVIALPRTGDLSSNSKDELEALVGLYDQDRFLGHMDKAHLIEGNACETIPKFIEEHPHLIVSLLFLDFDLYEPTKAAIEHFVPRMPKGAILAFDELDNPIWPGETQALMDTLQINNVQIEWLPWDPYIGFIRM